MYSTYYQLVITSVNFLYEDIKSRHTLCFVDNKYNIQQSKLASAL